MLTKCYKTKQFQKFAGILLISLIAISCATKPSAYKIIDLAVEKDDFKTAIEAIKAGQEDDKKPIYLEKNSIMLFLDKGLLEYYAGDYENSSKDLQEAERLIEEAYTKSITANFMSYIANDNTKEYPGEDFEDIYLNVFNALNYYNRGDIEGALVEIRKLSLPSGKLNMLAQRYDFKDKDGKSLDERVQEQAKGADISQLPKGKPVEFSNSALARYLAALFYLADGNTDSARIEFQEVPKAFASNGNVYKNPIPKAVAEAQTSLSKARLNVISFSGLSPIKQEEIVVHYFPFQNAALRQTNFKLPKLVARPTLANRVEVVIEGKDKFDLELLEDMGAVIQETFAVRYANIVIKTYIRALIKYTLADISAAETAKRTNALAGAAIALAAKKALEATEGADIRMSRFMPDKAFVGGIDLEPGNYNITINFIAGNTVVASVTREDFPVKEKSLNLIDVASLK